MKPLRRFFRASLLAVMLVTGAACISRQHEAKSFPAGASLAGSYRFAGLGSYQPYQFPNPLIDLSEIAEGSIVTITDSGGKIAARYRVASGEIATRSISLNALPEHSTWENGALTTRRREPVGGGFILPGAARHYRGSMIARGSGGDLRITGTFTEKGLMLFAIPFADYDECSILLRNVSG